MTATAFCHELTNEWHCLHSCCKAGCLGSVCDVGRVSSCLHPVLSQSKQCSLRWCPVRLVAVRWCRVRVVAVHVQAGLHPGGNCGTVRRSGGRCVRYAGDNLHLPAPTSVRVREYNVSEGDAEGGARRRTAELTRQGWVMFFGVVYLLGDLHLANRAHWANL